MGNPVPRQERSVPWCFRIAGRLVNFISFLTVSCFIFAVFSLVPKFKPGITWPETLAEKQRLFHSHTCGAHYTPPTSTFATSRQNVRKRVHRFQLISSLAFGGRGVGLLHKSNGRKVAHVNFDQTKGFPGEGWSNRHSNFRIATWNTRSMSVERFDYCQSLSYDVLAVTELWRTGSKFQSNNKAFVVGEAKIDKETEEVRFPKDRAAGVGILLSQAAEQKVLSFGSTGERVCFVRLEGPVCNLFIVATYLPHRGRVNPNQDDTIADLHEALKKALPNDCIVLLGDLNEQLGPNIQNRTGKWSGGQSSKNADKILYLMSTVCSRDALRTKERRDGAHLCLSARTNGWSTR